MTIHVFFDLDKTLFIQDERSIYKNLALKSNLTKIQNLVMGDVYFIYLKHTQELIEWLLDNGISVGFATASARPAEHVKPLLEEAFGLQEGRLKNSLYFNRVDHYKDRNLSKAKYIQSLNIDGEIILVDDNEREILEAQNLGYHAIEATGHEYDSEYLNKIQEHVKRHLTHISRKMPSLMTI